MSEALGAAYRGVLQVMAWNPPLLLALFAMMTAQAFKFATALLVRRRIDFTRLLGTGGMPSSHSASVTAMSTAVGISQGWSSTLFGVAAFISLVIMYDATGIRRAAGRQAQVLNRDPVHRGVSVQTVDHAEQLVLADTVFEAQRPAVDSHLFASFCLPPNVDRARRILTDQDHRKRGNGTFAAQCLDPLRDLRTQ